MARIKVNHKTLIDTANTLDQRIADHDSLLKQATAQVSNMQNNWSGMDYNQYKIQWTKVTEAGSVSKNVTGRMKAYSDYLRYASEQYKSAQTDAINRANKI